MRNNKREAYLREMLEAHPPIPTDNLRRILMECVVHHEEAELKDEENPPMIEITVCALMALARETLMYRDRYGLMELPCEDWKFIN